MVSKKKQPKNSKKSSKPSKLLKSKSVKKKDRISHSDLQAARCLHLYKKQVLEGKYKSGNDPMTAGSLVHSVIYKYTKYCVESRSESDFETMNNLIEEHFNKTKLPEEWYISLRTSLLDFAERGVTFDEILDYEKVFKVDIGGGIIVKGIIDRINSYRTEKGSVLEIIDYKNQANIDSEEDVKNNMQLNLYKYIAINFLFPGFDLVRTGIWHTKYNFVRWSSKYAIPIKDISTDLENTEAYLKRSWKRLQEATEYPASKGEQCWEYGGCPILVANQCPKYSEKEVEKMIAGSVEDQVRVARKMSIDLDRLVKELKLKMKDSELTIIDGKKVGYDKSVTSSYDLPKIIEYANEKVIPLTDITISRPQIDKAINKVTKIKEMEEDELIRLGDMKIIDSKTTFKYK